MDTAKQACREENIEAILDYISKDMGPNFFRIGIELEHLIVHSDGGLRVSYDEEHGIADLLRALSERYPDPVYNTEGDLLGVSRMKNGLLESVTLEPGGQLELSAGPFIDLNQALEIFEDFEDELNKILQGWDEQALLMGYTPVEEAESIPLIPKFRYECMDRHFRAIGPYGTCMMRGSASTQVSIDFFDERDCIRKLRLATAAAPLFSLMCDNTVIFEGELRHHHMIRTEIWNGVDRARSNVIPGLFNEDFSLRDYAAYVLDVGAIVAPDGEGGWREDGRSFGEIYADKPMRKADVIHALSMVFPDVRLKNYIELRTADAMPVPYAIAYATLIKGLFSTDDALETLEAMFGKVTERSIARIKRELMEKGYEAEVYGREAWRVIEQLHVTAKLHLSREEWKLIEPLTTLVFNHQTLAELTVFE